MTNIISLLAQKMAVALSLLGILTAVPAQYGAVIPQTAGLYSGYLASGISSTDTSMTLASGTLRDGTSLSGWQCFTLDANTPSVEYVCGTASGTSVTGMTRGIKVSDPNSSSSSLAYQHYRFATVQITDYPALEIIRRQLVGTDDINNILKYKNTITTAQIGASPYNLANVDYIASVAISGGALATDLIAGLTKLSLAPAVVGNPIAVGDNDTRVPTQGENDALVGTSGTPSSANKYVTNDDTATAATASKIVRRDASGRITIADPSASTDGATKGYVDGNPITQTNGVTNHDTAVTGTQTIAHGLGRTPKKIRITAIYATDTQSVGTYIGTTTSTVYCGKTYNGSSHVTTVATDSTNIIYVPQDPSTEQGTNARATVSVDGTNITLTWSKTGTTSGNVQIMWESQ